MLKLKIELSKNFNGIRYIVEMDKLKYILINNMLEYLRFNLNDTTQSDSDNTHKILKFPKKGTS